jgi:hypothetical protein
MIGEPDIPKHKTATAVGKAMKAIEIRATVHPVIREMLLAIS